MWEYRSKEAHMSVSKRIRMFNETLRVARDGCYELEGGTVDLRRTNLEHMSCRVFSSQEVSRLASGFFRPRAQRYSGACVFDVSAEDSFVAAQSLASEAGPTDRPPLVLNFANPYEPGGGVKRGARAQEEDLCRRSTLYLSLGSTRAKAYYRENRAEASSLFTDAAILSEHVEVFRDTAGHFLETPFEVAVLTMAAPYHPDLRIDEVGRLSVAFEQRILGLLTLAACGGYTRLVLGAWGCGAFGNDPQMVAEAFGEALRTFEVGDCGDDSRLLGSGEVFEHIRFAVLPGPNHDVFAQVFAGFSPVTQELAY
jgi:uncharacterized protein (TIGR02452 family)